MYEYGILTSDQFLHCVMMLHHSPSAQDINWYHLGGQRFVMFFGYIYMSLKLENTFWTSRECSYNFLEAF